MCSMVCVYAFVSRLALRQGCSTRVSYACAGVLAQSERRTPSERPRHAKHASVLQTLATSLDASRPTCNFRSALPSLRIILPPFRTLLTLALSRDSTHLNRLACATKDLSKGISISSDMPYCPNTNPIGPNTTPKGFGPNGFDSGMSFPGMPDSAASTPGGGYKNNGY